MNDYTGISDEHLVQATFNRFFYIECRRLPDEIIISINIEVSDKVLDVTDFIRKILSLEELSEECYQWFVANTNGISSVDNALRLENYLTGKLINVFEKVL